ncbi:MAG: hypothetical protein KAR45_06350 [Desulfobacteraceae bacterium]|nr:hypothetical protein [Desulfobacteraceae bacterium]
MSIENKKFIILHFFQYILVLCVCLTGFIYPDISSAWFSEDREEAVPFLNQPCSSDPSDISFSDTYVLLYNEIGQKKSFSIFPDVKSRFYIAADRVSIDIPLDVLSKNAIDPGESIDRLLAVNLRIKKILDEYSELDQRAALLLKGLHNPYLDDLNQKKRNRFTLSDQQESVSAGKKKLKKDLANVIKNSQSYRINSTKSNHQAFIALTRFKERRRSFNSTHSTQSQGSIHELERFRQASEVNRKKYFGGELPWILNVILKGLKYCIDHKVEMTLYTLLPVFFIFLISLKGRQ